MGKKLVIVGNAEPKRDSSKFIDQSDLVVRFNQTPYFDTGLIGEKTDVLALSGAPTSILRLCRHDTLNDAVVENSKTILFSREDLRDLSQEVVNAYSWNDSKIVTHISEVSIRRLILDMQLPPDAGHDVPPAASLYSRFVNPITGKLIIPSTGTCTIYHYLTDPIYSNHQIYVIGFEWKGHPDKHLWPFESKFCKHLINQERLKTSVF